MIFNLQYMMLETMQNTMILLELMMQKSDICEAQVVGNIVTKPNKERIHTVWQMFIGVSTLLYGDVDSIHKMQCWE
jgi:hypothetical protein